LTAWAASFEPVGNVMRSASPDRDHDFHDVVAVHNVARLAAQLSASNGIKAVHLRKLL
jgi:hypothetical protein